MMFTAFVSIHSPLITCIIIIIIIIIWLLAVVPLSNSDESAEYAACSDFPYSCGQIQNIGYPFWGANRPDFCGVSDLKLVCRNDSHNYINQFQNNSITLPVLGINTSSRTVKFTQSNLFNRCYLQDSNVAYPPSLKPILDADYRNITLFYGCNNSNCDDSIYYQPMSFSCFNSDGTTGTAYYFADPSIISKTSDDSDLSSSECRSFTKCSGGADTSCSCQNNVTFQIEKRGLDELRTRNASLLSVLQRWSNVTLEYNGTFTAACSNCQESGGICGSAAKGLPSDQFACYCQDGSHPLQCSHINPNISKAGAAAAISLLGTMVLVALIVFAKKRQNTSKFSFLWSSRQTTGDQNIAVFLQSYGSLAPKRYTYAGIKKMTSSFKDKLGEGGYGSVYKGTLHNGRFVAVKKLKVVKGDGKDFINEVLSISRTNHVNVVTLLGFCFEGNKRALVFEFMPNGSLEKFIHGKEIRQSLQWETMFNIAIGIARGLDYLHRGCNTRILHFDIKPHNILLDDEFCPKISDFGLARLCPKQNSMISMSEARGTIGYIAPEVFCRNFGGVSHKSDVYSYGMMLIDLVCSRKIPTNEVQHDNSELYFPEWIYNRLEPVQEAAVGEIEDNDKNELERKMILVSLWCIQMHPSDRPPINRVVELLEGPFESLPIPPKPHASSPARSVFT